ncbi:hypothetical protein [Brevundimonas sp. PAMC22021]|uniref:hypothetical protein n=1 Tax=Brevundimonas sp. PAMC22021 TaxID=2861285 RepID=UPI001C625314|nr:hypothetical protein [Brevundimonas sp. PAMC22021]QYF87989.1 hypothetical protein KY493_05770 [Brevundimonas sp. PAMC22021]
MNRFDPNLLLAVSTGVALILLVMTAGLYGVPGAQLKYGLLAAICALVFVVANGPVSRMMHRDAKPLIRRDAPATAVWAGLFPIFAIAAAAVPVFAPGRDYGLLVIIVALLFGLTIDSALKARKGD